MVDRIPSLGVIVVHFGQPALTLRCLQHLQEQRGIDLEVVLVDNSPNGDAPNFQELGWRIQTLRCSNHGFAHANNQGLAQLRSASVEGVLLLNNDAFSMEGALHALWVSHDPNPKTRLGGDGGRMSPERRRYATNERGLLAA